MPIEIKYTQDPSIIKELGRNRVNSWVEAGASFHDGFLNDEQAWIDDIDLLPQSHHWLAIYEGHIIGAARLSYHDSLADVPDSEEFLQFESQLKFPVAALSRLFVRKDFWGLGVGQALLEARLKFVKEQNAVKNLICFVCGQDRVKLMQQFGFKILAVRDTDKFIVIPKKFYVMVADVHAIPHYQLRPSSEEAFTASYL